eukprot:5485264-Prymnesium_polylepis.1
MAPTRMQHPSSSTTASRATLTGWRCGLVRSHRRFPCRDPHSPPRLAAQAFCMLAEAYFKRTIQMNTDRNEHTDAAFAAAFAVTRAGTALQHVSALSASECYGSCSTG